MAQLVKNPPAMQETQIQSLNLEGPLEKEMKKDFFFNLDNIQAKVACFVHL